MAAAEETAKDDTKIHVNQLPLPPQLAVSRLSVDGEDLMEEQRVEFPLFRPTSQRSENSWIISLFVIIHLVVFAATMIVNDCWHNSHGDCAIKPLGRLSFHPLAENPLLGPSASALDNVGAIRQTLLTDHHQFWRVLTSPWLHAGLVHIIINLCSVVFVGIHLEQEFGSLRIGVTYILSGVTATLLAALFVTDNSSVTSSSALFGLPGMMLSGLIRYWKLFTKKLAAILLFLIILMINLILGLVPYINNISNVGGFISGFLIGFVLLFEPQLDRIAQKKGGLFEYDLKHKVQKKQKWDRPVLRGVSLAILMFVFAGVSIAVLRGTNVSKYCSWCQCIDSIPSKWWICADKAKHCEAMIYSDQLTLTCTDNGNFRVFPTLTSLRGGWRTCAV